MVTSFEKWPCEIKITRIATIALGKEMNLYFVTGLMNKAQYDILRQETTILSDFRVSEDQWVISTVLEHQQLLALNKAFQSRAKSWRGQYYVLSNRVIEACKPYLEN